MTKPMDEKSCPPEVLTRSYSEFWKSVIVPNNDPAPEDMLRKFGKTMYLRLLKTEGIVPRATPTFDQIPEIIYYCPVRDAEAMWNQPPTDDYGSQRVYAKRGYKVVVMFFSGSPDQFVPVPFSTQPYRPESSINDFVASVCQLNFAGAERFHANAVNGKIGYLTGSITIAPKAVFNKMCSGDDPYHISQDVYDGMKVMYYLDAAVHKHKSVIFEALVKAEMEYEPSSPAGCAKHTDSHSDTLSHDTASEVSSNELARRSDWASLDPSGLMTTDKQAIVVAYINKMYEEVVNKLKNTKSPKEKQKLKYEVAILGHQLTFSKHLAALSLFSSKFRKVIETMACAKSARRRLADVKPSASMSRQWMPTPIKPVSKIRIEQVRDATMEVKSLISGYDHNGNNAVEISSCYREGMQEPMFLTQSYEEFQNRKSSDYSNSAKPRMSLRVRIPAYKDGDRCYIPNIVDLTRKMDDDTIDVQELKSRLDITPRKDTAADKETNFTAYGIIDFEINGMNYEMKDTDGKDAVSGLVVDCGVDLVMRGFCAVSGFSTPRFPKSK